MLVLNDIVLLLQMMKTPLNAKDLEWCAGNLPAAPSSVEHTEFLDVEEQQSSKTASKSKVKSKPQQVHIYRSFSTNSVRKSGQLQRTKNLHLSLRLRNPSAKFKSSLVMVNSETF